MRPLILILFFTFLVGDLALAKLKSSTNKDGSEKFWSFIEPQKLPLPKSLALIG